MSVITAPTHNTIDKIRGFDVILKPRIYSFDVVIPDTDCSSSVCLSDRNYYFDLTIHNLAIKKYLVPYARIGCGANAYVTVERIIGGNAALGIGAKATLSNGTALVADGALGIGARVLFSSDSIVDLRGKIGIGGNVEMAMIRQRYLSDLEGAKLSDINDMTLQNLYFIEEI